MACEMEIIISLKFGFEELGEKNTVKNNDVNMR